MPSTEIKKKVFYYLKELRKLIIPRLLQIKCVDDILAFIGGAFFWDSSRIGILGIDGICVLLGAIPFSE